VCFKEAIRLLDKEYGDKQLLVNLYLNKLRKWPKIPLNNPTAYKKLHRFLLSGLTYKRDGTLNELDSETVIRTCILAKMDRSIQDKWLNKVVRAREKNQAELNFKDLVKFVEHISLLASEPSYSQLAYKNDCNPDVKSFGINVNHPEDTTPSTSKIVPVPSNAPLTSDSKKPSNTKRSESTRQNSSHGMSSRMPSSA
jgi:hypothetical protein